MEFGYRLQLKQELTRRREGNPRFSLRSFARMLDLSPAFLSKILHGQKSLSPEKALAVATRLRYDANEISQFCRLVELERKSEPLRRALASGESDVLKEEALLLQLDVFQVIADWHHYAIRELVATKGFRDEPQWIAARLGVSPGEAKDALARLARLGLVERRQRVWVRSHSFVATPSDQPSRALRHHHAQMIEKAKRSIEEQAIDRRDVSGVTIPISPEKVTLAKEEIRKFRRRMVKLLGSSAPTQVYQLNVQFFELTRPTQSKDEK